MNHNFFRERKSASDHELFLHKKISKLHWPLRLCSSKLAMFSLRFRDAAVVSAALTADGAP